MNAERIVYYINVGQMPPYKSLAYIEKIKDQLKNRTLYKDLDEFFIPIREENARIEVFTKNDKDEWIKENPLVLETLQTIEIEQLKSKLENAQEKIKQLERPWWKKLFN